MQQLLLTQGPHGSHLVVTQEGSSQGHTVGLGGMQGLYSEALTQLEYEEIRASREPTRSAASTSRQEYKGYKISLQEYEGNADKKASTCSIR